MQVTAVCAFAIGSTLLVVIIKQFRGELRLPIALCVLICILAVGIGLLGDIRDFVASLWDGRYSKYHQTMLKALGISMVASFASDICRDAGETSIAGAVETVAKCELLCLSLPLLRELTQLALLPVSSL